MKRLSIIITVRRVVHVEMVASFILAIIAIIFWLVFRILMHWSQVLNYIKLIPFVARRWTCWSQTIVIHPTMLKSVYPSSTIGKNNLTVTMVDHQFAVCWNTRDFQWWCKLKCILIGIRQYTSSISSCCTAMIFFTWLRVVLRWSSSFATTDVIVLLLILLHIHRWVRI